MKSKSMNFTVLYAAPELLFNSDFKFNNESLLVDIWSLGLLFFQVFLEINTKELIDIRGNSMITSGIIYNRYSYFSSLYFYVCYRDNK
jgi:serine/threonine protein kinase